jgi:hypothetical protein
MRRRCLTANSYENTPQSRIRGVGREARNDGKICCRRVFPDARRQDFHVAAHKHLPVGESSA